MFIHFYKILSSSSWIPKNLQIPTLKNLRLSTNLHLNRVKSNQRNLHKYLHNLHSWSCEESTLTSSNRSNWFYANFGESTSTPIYIYHSWIWITSIPTHIESKSSSSTHNNSHTDKFSRNLHLHLHIFLQDLFLHLCILRTTSTPIILEFWKHLRYLMSSLY